MKISRTRILCEKRVGITRAHSRKMSLKSPLISQSTNDKSFPAKRKFFPQNTKFLHSGNNDQIFFISNLQMVEQREPKWQLETQRWRHTHKFSTEKCNFYNHNLLIHNFFMCIIFFETEKKSNNLKNIKKCKFLVD